MKALRSVLALAGVLAAICTAHAQSDYPNKPVRLIVDSAAGSANDATARILGDKLSAIWGQQVVVMNQPGAGGAIAARFARLSGGELVLSTNADNIGLHVRLRLPVVAD